ncbi:MAG: Hpt domain-containing protein [Pseudomonadota bacterium]
MPSAPAEVQLPGVDTAQGLHLVGGDGAFYLKLLERFWRSHQGTAQACSAEAAAGDWPALAHRAHSLRGSAASVGAQALREAAEALELAASRQADVPVALAALLPALDTVVQGLEQFFAGRHDPDQVLLLNKAEAMAAQAQLVVLLDDFSGDVPDFFEQVRPSLAQLLTASAMQDLAGHIERYEFQAARAVLAGALCKNG